MATLLAFTALAALAGWAVSALRPRTARFSALREVVVRRAAFPLPVAQPGEPDYDPLYSTASRKILGEASARRRPFRPTSIVALGAPASVSARGLLHPSNQQMAAAALRAGASLSIAPHGLRFETLGATDVIIRLGGERTDRLPSGARFSMAHLLEITDAHRQAKAIEIALGSHTSRHLPIHDADSLLDFCESIASTTGLPVGLRADADDVPFWMDLTRLIDTTRRSVDFVAVPADADILEFAVGFSRVQKLFAMRSLHGRTGFIAARGAWTTDEALFAFALGCDLVEINGPHSLRTSGIATAIVDTRRDILTACRQSGALHPADILASQIEVLDPPCWSRTVAELFGGRGIGSACGDERRFIDVVDRGNNALPFRRRH